MILPHKIATLLYCFNKRDEVLLMERAQEPNLGLWSPPGGKLHAPDGESPHGCAAREAGEELGLEGDAATWRLTGIVSEVGYLGQAHWLMFLFELKGRLAELPQPHREGRFQFFKREELAGLMMPEADRQMIWPLFWEHRGGFFAAQCQAGEKDWVLEESRKAHG